MFFKKLLGKCYLMNTKMLLWKNISRDQMGVVVVSHIQDEISAHSGREADTEVLQN